MLADLREAIQGKKVVRIRYDGESRIVEPYTYGETSKGNDAIRVFQRSGGSSSGKDTGWKLLVVDKIESLDITNEQFEVHEQYRPNDRGMKTIYEQVEL